MGLDSDSGNCGSFQEVFSGYSGGILGSEGVSECQGRQGFEQIATCVGQSLQHTQPHSYLSRITTVFPHMKGPKNVFSWSKHILRMRRPVQLVVNSGSGCDPSAESVASWQTSPAMVTSH